MKIKVRVTGLMQVETPMPSDFALGCLVDSMQVCACVLRV